MSATAAGKGKAPAMEAGPVVTPPEDDQMLDREDSDEDSDDESEPEPEVPVAGPSNVGTTLSDAETLTARSEARELRKQVAKQAKQLASLMDLVEQLTAQVTAPDGNVTRTRKPKMATPEKYEGGRTELRAFLTNVDLYCAIHEVPNDQEKILMATLHMKGRAANWVQPYTEDYLRSPGTNGEKQDTQQLFASWNNFKDEMGRIFGEVDAESQAEKAITCLKQTKSVSAYTAEFKQLQAKIDWDDAALRTVFERGLKESVKDGLVHHPKPEDLQAMIELATRIDNRLWERAQQKARTATPVANTKKHRHRSRRDRDGDVIMADKVSEKPRHKKSNHGLSAEERQRRYDKKACLRCGEVGHFRDKCPENTKTGRQGAVKIGMIRRASTPYPGQSPKDTSLLDPPGSDEDVSDLELWEEAKLLENAAYELIPRAKEAPDVVERDNTKPVDWTVTSQEIRQRLHEHKCWICGGSTHMAEDCDHEGRIAITGPKAEEAAYQAVNEQPYFARPETEQEPVATRKQQAVWMTPGHQALHWTECDIAACKFHVGKRKTAGWRISDDWHGMLKDNECRVEQCHIHIHTRKPMVLPQPSQGLDPKIEDGHEQLHWSECSSNDCPTHEAAITEYVTRRNGHKSHRHLTDNQCLRSKCPWHEPRETKLQEEDSDVRYPELPKGQEDPTTQVIRTTLHKSLHWSDCELEDCWYHENEEERENLPGRSQGVDRATRGKAPSPDNSGIMDTSPGRLIHEKLHWSQCYTDSCLFHMSDKNKAGCLKKRSEKGRRKRPDLNLRERYDLMHENLKQTAREATRSSHEEPGTLSNTVRRQPQCIHWPNCKKRSCEAHRAAKEDMAGSQSGRKN